MQYNMMTSNQQTLPFGEDASMSSREDSHANHSQQPGSEKVQKITAISGQKCCEQFAKFVPAGSWARTFSELLIGTEEWYSNKCTLTWKLKGTRFRRLYFQLAPSAPHINDTAHGLSPTLLKAPSAMDARSENLSKKEQRFGNSGTLAQEVQTGFIYKRGLLPTPRTTDIGRGTVKDVRFENGTYFRVNKKGVRFGVNITDVIASGLLPTPKAQDCRHALRDRGKSNLGGGNERVKFPTDWSDFPTQSPVCSRDDGFPIPMDGIAFPKWRAEAIKAYGNAIVPQVAYRIFDTINKYERL